MPLVVPDVGLTYLVDALVASVTPWVHLYQTDTALTRRTTLADLVELDTPDYVPQRAVGWSPATLRGMVAVTEADPLRWIRGAGGTPRDVYGYYVTDGRNGPLVWCQRAPTAPIPMRVLGDRLLVIARFALGVCTPGTMLGTADMGLSTVGTMGPSPIRGVADLVVDAASSVPSPPLLRMADLVVDAASSVPSPPLLRMADLVVDGLSADLLVRHTADLVVDGVSTTGPYELRVGGDLVADAVSETGPPLVPTTADVVLDDDQLI